MTTNLETISGRYRKADFNDRLSMFLQFPELRREFLEIELKEGPQNCFEPIKPPSKYFNLSD